MRGSDCDITKKEIVRLLELEAPEEVEELFRRADGVRRERMGEEVHLRGIIEISNHCERRCAYCGIRAGSGVNRYRMTPGEIVKRALLVARLPVKTIVLQSGVDRGLTAEMVADIVRRIKAEADAAITLSLGERDDETYRLWREAGADRYLLKHETANPVLFAKLKPDSSFAERLGRLKALKRAGFQAGSGNMIGLPGQTLEDIAGDILLCRELDVDMAAFGPFIPAEGTPLAGAATGSAALSLKAIAAARILLPDAHIPANTALATVDPAAQIRALSCGANVVMPNFTPARYRSRYRIYPNLSRFSAGDDLAEIRRRFVDLVQSAGRMVATGYGGGRESRIQNSESRMMKRREGG